MIPLHQLEKSIPDLTGLAVLVIAACSFILSFFNLQAAAIEAGINPWLSWLWPVCIDALMIAGSLMILRSSLRKEPAYVGWSVLLMFTGISTLFNVLHSPEDMTARAAHAVPPVALCISIELLMLCVRSDLTRPEEEPEVMSAPVQVQQESTPAPGSTAERIIQYFAEQPGSSSREAAMVLGLHRSTINRHLKTLSASGMLQQVSE